MVSFRLGFVLQLLEIIVIILLLEVTEMADGFNEMLQLLVVTWQLKYQGAVLNNRVFELLPIVVKKIKNA